MPSRPPSPSAWTLIRATGSFFSLRFLSRRRTVPGRSVTSAPPSGRKTSSHGTCRPLTTVPVGRPDLSRSRPAVGACSGSVTVVVTTGCLSPPSWPPQAVSAVAARSAAASAVRIAWMVAGGAGGGCPRGGGGGGGGLGGEGGGGGGWGSPGGGGEVRRRGRGWGRGVTRSGAVSARWVGAFDPPYMRVESAQ